MNKNRKWNYWNRPILNAIQAFKQSNKGKRENGGASRDRTDDLIRARDALSQLSYGPTKGWVDYQKV